MEENNDINKLSASDVQQLKMTPPDHAWNRLDAELARKQALIDREKANRYKFLFFITGLLLLCSVGYLYFSHREVKTIASTPSIYKVQAPIQNTTSNNQLQNSSVNNKTIIDNSSSVGAGHSMAKPVAINSTAFSKNPMATNHGNAPLPNNNTSVLSNSTKKQSANNVPVKTTSSTTDIAANNDKVSDDMPDETRVATLKDSATTIMQTASNNLTQENIATNETISNTSNALQPDSHALSSATNVSDTFKSPSNPDLTTATPVKTSSADKLNTLKNKNVLSRFSIAGSFLPYYSKNSLKESGSSNLYQLYSTPEKTNFSFATGLTIRYDLTDNLSVSLGGSYSTLAYSVTVPAIYAYYNNNWQLHYLFPTACGLVEMPNSNGTTATYNGESLNNVTCSQVVRFINLPLQVRYKVSLNKFTAYAEGGIAANFTIQERANITVNNTETKVINNIDGLKNKNYSFVCGIGLQYNLNSRTGIFAEPSFSRSINSLTENIAVNCYPYSIGLNTGISFHF